jgi:hypothetical protein
VSGTESLSETLGIPSSCLGATTCDQLAAGLQGALADAGVSAACTTSALGCVCTVSGSALAIDTSGTYTTSGTNVTTTPTTGGTSSTSGYCVQGSTLYILNAPGMTGGGASEIVAQKQ